VIQSGGPSVSRDGVALLFVAEMYGVQLDQLAALLAVTPGRAAAVAARWRASGAADTAMLSPGPRWVWLTRAGLAACGLPYRAAAPGLSRLAATPQFRAGPAYWRSERRLRARIGGRIGLREHVPDGEVHWPDGTAIAWAGECWAIEAELTRKTLARTVTIMREVLTRTGDYGCLAADVRVPGQQPRHARAIYLCTADARPVVSRARDALGRLGERVEIRLLPTSAALGGGTP
jgi:hypothetical protein